MRRRGNSSSSVAALLEDHCFRLIFNELFNGLPSQLHNKWSFWGIRATISDDSGSMQLVLFLTRFLICL